MVVNVDNSAHLRIIKLMQVELRTKDGLLKSQTECAPNGYFFIPMYEKGSFVLKVWFS